MMIEKENQKNSTAAVIISNGTSDKSIFLTPYLHGVGDGRKASSELLGCDATGENTGQHRSSSLRFFFLD
jgi:hypothetical protein